MKCWEISIPIEAEVLPREERLKEMGVCGLELQLGGGLVNKTHRESAVLPASPRSRHLYISVPARPGLRVLQMIEPNTEPSCRKAKSLLCIQSLTDPFLAL